MMRNVVIFCILLFTSILTGCTRVFTNETPEYSLLDIVDEVNMSTHQVSAMSKNSRVLSSVSDEHLGLDISHYQGNILQEIAPKDSLHFMICKATQGNFYVDPDFRINWREIADKGLIRGAYHFYICDDDPIRQANHFLDNIEDIQETDIAPILDIEQGSMSKNTEVEKMSNDLLAFLHEVEKKIKRRPIIYTDYAFAQEYLKNPEFSKYDLWLAEYSGVEYPKVPVIWEQTGFKIWQRTDQYTEDHRKTDLDIFYGHIHNLYK